MVNINTKALILNRRLLPILLFFFFFLIFFATSGGHIMTVDGANTFRIAKHLVDGSLPSIGDLPTYIVAPVLAVPLFVIANIIGVPPVNFVPLFFNSIILAMATTVMFFLSKEIFYSERIAFVLSLIFAFTSYIWPYGSGMLARPLAILFMLLVIYFIIKNKNNERFYFPIFAGVSLWLMGLTHSLFYLLLPGLVIFGFWEFRKNRKSLIVFVISIALFFLVQASLNDYRFGTVFDFGFGNQLENHSTRFLYENWDGIYGFLVSPDHSIFVYFPIALLSPIGFYYLYKKNPSLTILFIFIFIVTYGFIATTETASGNELGKWNSIGAIWGPHRYLLPLIPIITISLGSILTKFDNWKTKITILVLSIPGFIVNFVGTLVFWRLAFNYGIIHEKLYYTLDGSVSQNFLEPLTWEPKYSMIALSLKVLKNNYVDFQFPEHALYTVNSLAGCNYDIYLLCVHGLLALIVTVIPIIFLAYLIMHILNSSSKLDKQMK